MLSGMNSGGRSKDSQSKGSAHRSAQAVFGIDDAQHVVQRVSGHGKARCWLLVIVCRISSRSHLEPEICAGESCPRDASLVQLQDTLNHVLFAFLKNALSVPVPPAPGSLPTSGRGGRRPDPSRRMTALVKGQQPTRDWSAGEGVHRGSDGGGDPLRVVQASCLGTKLADDQ